MTQKHSITLSAVQPRPPKKRKLKAIVPGSAEDVLLSDIKSLLQRHRPGLQGVETAGSPSKRTDRPFSRFTELEIEIQELGSLGTVLLPALVKSSQGTDLAWWTMSTMS